MSVAGVRLTRATAGRAVRGGRGRLVVVAATTPQFKSTKHHQRSRPKKTRASDKNRKPAQYEPLPPPPPEFEVVAKAKPSSSDE
ncbi:plastid ribosomal protein L6 [Chloropicon primus]|uniref:Plastid ribosomal protein L6 n=1 Tax=Chloropicon primus TaxID=1764295 RepID=A0A5B8MHN4_9CHLO|nr:plastid ribosomal protein L6 [Chloropicon primus]UPQ99174.1 plastid ribosomal protein L6 [Chloropicon primus]|mmetsp:Transcript_14485/g.41247  ORF Transcript_14485/g.41247 Transcript_14485/m.41247 type:complete len:84 (+) Transcript_14485:119-370(+)|eukprot:QDZ19963.1 plastid ribosomal protein L6 [Chloropicon primus]